MTTLVRLTRIAAALPLLMFAYLFRCIGFGSHSWMPGANAYETVDWMMQEALDLLVNKPAVAAHFNTEVQKEFEKEFAPGETVRVKYPQEYLIRDGLQYTEQPITRRHTNVSCTQIFGIDFGWDSYEKAVKMERSEAVISREYLEPAMAQMSQEIESRCAQFAYQNASAMVGVLGTNPTTFDASSAAARELMVNLGCPPGKDRAMIVTPAIMRALKNTNASAFNPVPDVSKMLRTGVVGYGDGFDWYESVSLYQHTAGTWAGAVTMSSGGQSGSSIAVACTTGDTFNAGDKFSIASTNSTNPRTRRKVGASAKTFTVTQATVGAASAATLQISPAIFGPGSQYQNVDALPGNGAALTLFPGTTSPSGKVGTVNLAIHPDAFALVGVEFENPIKGSVEVVKQLKDDETGLVISFIRAFDPVGRRWINRFDTCLGFGPLWSDNCCVAVLGA